MIAAFVDALRPGETRLARSADVGSVLEALRKWGEEAADRSRVILCNWPQLPDATAVIDQSIDALARTALAIWPGWYGLPPTASGTCSAERKPRGVSLAWLEAATSRCRNGRIPRPSKFNNAIQAAQLALAIEPDRLRIVLAQSASNTQSESLLGFARAAEWIAKETAAPVLVLVPAEVAGSSALDSVSFGAIDLPGEPRPAPSPSQEKQSLLVWPLHGSPHPDSPGEQRLARQLLRDDQLAGLFGFNQPVQTVRGSRFTVDLLWERGRVVVEVDGYAWHSGPAPFQQDRHRDYELLTSGYLVLRLTHDEVMDDVGLAIEKIRDVVALRQQEFSSKGVCR